MVLSIDIYLPMFTRRALGTSMWVRTLLHESLYQWKIGNYLNDQGW